LALQPQFRQPVATSLCDQIDESTAFTAGLVRIGELMMRAPPAEAMMDLNRVPMLDLKRSRAQQGLFGCSYADVGASPKWRFPTKMMRHNPAQTAPFENESEPMPA
jgi:hypothetical protein